MTIGINWLCAAVLIKFPWTATAWACPFFTLPMPPEQPLRSSKNKADLTKSGRHKTLNQWTSQLLRLLALSLKNIAVTIVADSAFCTYELANTAIDNNVFLISRMRMDARTFEFPTAKGRGRPRLVGKRLPTFKQMVKQNLGMWQSLKVCWYGNKMKEILVQSGTCLWYGYGIRPVPIRWVLVKDGSEVAVLISTNLNHTPTFIIETFVQRWKIETTFEEVRRHLGMETQRQWSDKAIDRTTPTVLASYSIINLMAAEIMGQNKDLLKPQSTAWYKKDHISFSDVLKMVRGQILEAKHLLGFGKNNDPMKKRLKELLDQLAAA